jgi:hypothetical protein
MLDPALWASTPFRNPTAYLDLVGSVELWHRALAQQIFRTTGETVRVYPLGNGGGPEFLQAVQSQYVEMARALGVAPPGDLASYDLSRPDDWASWTWQLSQNTRVLQNAAGLV